MTNAIVIRNEMDIMTLGKVLADSNYFTDSKQAAQAVVKVMAGQELGFGPVASMTGIHIIQGKVALGSNLLAAAIKRSGRYNYRVTKHDNDGCAIQFFEGGEVVGTSEFNKTDAQAAGLLNKDNWKKFPRNMYFSRALSNGQKWYCPDVGNGAPLYTPDELGADVDGETGEVITVHSEIIEPAPKTTASKAPSTDAELLEIVNSATDGYYNGVDHLRNAIRKAVGDKEWQFPQSEDVDGWREAFVMARDHALASNQADEVADEVADSILGADELPLFDEDE